MWDDSSDDTPSNARAQLHADALTLFLNCVTVSAATPPPQWTTRKRVLDRVAEQYAIKLRDPLNAALLVGFDTHRLPPPLLARVSEAALDIARVIARLPNVAAASKADVAKRVTHALRDPQNQQLRLSVLKNEVPAAKLVAMDADELANPEVRRQREELRKQLNHLRNATVAAFDNATITELFSCPKCGCERCFMVARPADKQKWSGDDATPINLSCVACGHSFRQ